MRCSTDGARRHRLRARVAIVVTAALAATFSSVTVPVAAADGDLDPNFLGGIVTASFGPSTDSAQATVVQPDGKVIAVGWGLNFAAGHAGDPGAAIYMAMARFNTKARSTAGSARAARSPR
jgi:hypothetical protein